MRLFLCFIFASVMTVQAEIQRWPMRIIETTYTVNSLTGAKYNYEAEINKYLSEVKEFDKAKVEYAKNLAAHQEAEAERIRQFKVDLFVAYGVTGHPKAEKAFNLAWEFGHSGGLHEVELYFSTLVALIKH